MNDYNESRLAEEIAYAEKTGLSAQEKADICAKWAAKDAADQARAAANKSAGIKSYADMTPEEKLADEERVVKANRAYFNAHPKDDSARERREARAMGHAED